MDSYSQYIDTESVARCDLNWGPWCEWEGDRRTFTRAVDWGAGVVNRSLNATAHQCLLALPTRPQVSHILSHDSRGRSLKVRLVIDHCHWPVVWHGRRIGTGDRAFILWKPPGELRVTGWVNSLCLLTEIRAGTHDGTSWPKLEALIEYTRPSPPQALKYRNRWSDAG